MANVKECPNCKQEISSHNAVEKQFLDGVKKGKIDLNKAYLRNKWVFSYKCLNCGKFFIIEYEVQIFFYLNFGR